MIYNDTTFKKRTLTWILFLCFIHTVPMPWFLIQLDGTEPLYTLFLISINGVLSISDKNMLNTLYFMGASLICFLIFYLISKVCCWLICRTPVEKIQMVIVLLVVSVLFGISITQPVYVSVVGDTNTYTNAREVLDILVKKSSLFQYYIYLLMLVFSSLFLMYMLPALRSVFSIVGNRYIKQLVVVLIIIGVFYSNQVLFIYKPIAEMNISWAEFRIGEHLEAGKLNKLLGNQDPGYWYTRAGNNGNLEASIKMYERYKSHKDRIYWLEVAAKIAGSESQDLLYKKLMRYKSDSERLIKIYKALKQSANMGYSNRQYNIKQGVILFDADLESLNRAYELLGKDALNKNGVAQYALASIYASTRPDNKPESFKKDVKKLRYWFDHSVENNFIPAMQLAAKYYEKGNNGFPIDKKRARDIYKKLIEHFQKNQINGVDSEQNFIFDYKERISIIDNTFEKLEKLDPETLKEVAYEYLRAPSASSTNKEQGLSYLKKLAEIGNAEESYQIAEIYFMGLHGIVKDMKKSHEWWELAAEHGNLAAMERVVYGKMQGNFGYKTDLIEARKQVERLLEAYKPNINHNKKAMQKYKTYRSYMSYIERQLKSVGDDYLSPAETESQDIDTQYKLGLQLIKTGHYDEPKEGIDLLIKAAEGGHIEAGYYLVSKRHERIQEFFDRNPEKAQIYLIRAAEVKHPRAMSVLAFAYENGRYGLKQDFPKAIELFQKTVAILELEQDNSFQGEMFFNMNKNRIDAVKRRMKYKSKKEEEYKNANDYERKVIAIKQKHSDLFAKRYNSMCVNNTRCTDKYIKRESERIEVEVNRLRDAELEELERSNQTSSWLLIGLWIIVIAGGIFSYFRWRKISV